MNGKEAYEPWKKDAQFYFQPDLMKRLLKNTLLMNNEILSKCCTTHGQTLAELLEKGITASTQDAYLIWEEFINQLKMKSSDL